ncbi:MAG: sensor histidine kinase [Streptosporangiales bacterium]|nr:sensor histidine kinase [Streptosporangiales bacterium]
MRTAAVAARDCGQWPQPWWVRPAAVVLAILIMLLPAVHVAEVQPVWLGWATIALAAALFLTAVWTADRGPYAERRVPHAALIALAALAFAVTATYPPHWYGLFLLLAVGEGVVLRTRWTSALVVLTAAAVAGMVLLRGGSGNEAIWAAALPTFFAGVTPHGFRRLSTALGELARARGELALAAVTAERERFSRDLHDLLGHTLSVIVVKAEAVRRLPPRDAEAAAAHAADIETIGRQALGEVREAVAGYRTADLKGELARARDALATAGIGCTVEESGPPLQGTEAILAGWVIREGVTNVLRHSGAETCRIAVHAAEDPVRLIIDDDGRGGDPSPETGSSGLRGLRERLAVAGGNLHATGDATGFVLTAEIPRAVREETS